MRTARSMSMTKILPSPILPVCADLVIASITWSVRSAGHDDLDLHLRQEVHVVFGTTVDFGLALLPAEPLHLRDGEALHAEWRQCLAHVVELEGLDDGHDQLHVAAPWLLSTPPPPSRRDGRAGAQSRIVPRRTVAYRHGSCLHAAVHVISVRHGQVWMRSRAPALARGADDAAASLPKKRADNSAKSKAPPPFLSNGGGAAGR